MVETNAVTSPSRCAALPRVMAVPLALRRGRCRHFLPTSPMVPVPLLLSSAGIEFGGAFVPLFVPLRRKAAAGNGVRVPPHSTAWASIPQATNGPQRVLGAVRVCISPHLGSPPERHRHSSTDREYTGIGGDALRAHTGTYGHLELPAAFDHVRAGVAVRIVRLDSHVSWSIEGGKGKVACELRVPVR